MTAEIFYALCNLGSVVLLTVFNVIQTKRLLKCQDRVREQEAWVIHLSDENERYYERVMELTRGKG